MQGRGRVEVLAMSVVAEGLQVDEFSALPSPSTHAFTSSAAPLPEPAAANKGQAAANKDKVVIARAPESVSTSDPRDGEAAASPSHNTTPLAGISVPVSDLVYCGTIETIPEAHATRKERFAELDTLQPGWTVELRNKGSTIEAIFFAPNGEKVGAFANARRMALAFHKASTA
jgi:hypothetical protein